MWEAGLEVGRADQILFVQTGLDDPRAVIALLRQQIRQSACTAGWFGRAHLLVAAPPAPDLSRKRLFQGVAAAPSRRLAAVRQSAHAHVARARRGPCRSPTVPGVHARSSVSAGTTFCSHARARSVAARRSASIDAGKCRCMARAATAVAVTTLRDSGGRTSMVVQCPSDNWRFRIRRAKTCVASVGLAPISSSEFSHEPESSVGSICMTAWTAKSGLPPGRPGARPSAGRPRSQTPRRAGAP